MSREFEIFKNTVQRSYNSGMMAIDDGDWSELPSKSISPSCISLPVLNRRHSLSIQSFEPNRPSKKKPTWLSLQGPFVGDEEATSAKSIGKELGKDETVAWELFSPMERVLAVAIVGAAEKEGMKRKEIVRLECSVKIRILAYISQVHKVVLPDGVVDNETVTLDQIESNIVRCPDPDYAQKMIDAIDVVHVKGDSVGVVVTCVARNVPKGLGSPVFDKLEADLATAVLSLPATKAFEFGSGFAGRFLMGSEHNDEFNTDENGNIRTTYIKSFWWYSGKNFQWRNHIHENSFQTNLHNWEEIEHCYKRRYQNRAYCQRLP